MLRPSITIKSPPPPPSSTPIVDTRRTTATVASTTANAASVAAAIKRDIDYSAAIKLEHDFNDDHDTAAAAVAAVSDAQMNYMVSFWSMTTIISTIICSNMQLTCARRTDGRRNRPSSTPLITRCRPLLLLPLPPPLPTSHHHRSNRHRSCTTATRSPSLIIATIIRPLPSPPPP